MNIQDLLEGYKETPLLYISGPFSNKDSLGFVTKQASQISLECFKRGWSVISPHKNCLGFLNEDMIYEKWMYALAAQIAKCDAVLLLPGWEKSEGTCMEVEFCKKLDIPIYDLLRDGIPDPNEMIL